MVARVKLLQDTSDDPKTGLDRRSVHSKTKPRTRTLGPASRTRRKKKATFTGKDGDKPSPAMGRPPGSVNKTTRILKEAILLAAEQTGENLRGRHGLVGYLRRIARKEPKAFTALLGRVLPMQVNVQGEIDHTHEHRHYDSTADIRKALRERGITVDEIYERPMKVIEHRKDELELPEKKKSAVERALVNV
jgi:hypothetical protein